MTALPDYNNTKLRLTFKKLATIINREFGEPFLAKDVVNAVANKDGTFTLHIDCRDVTIDTDGAVVDSGTLLRHMSDEDFEKAVKAIEKLAKKVKTNVRKMA